MKGVKTMSMANGTARVFQSSDIYTERVHLPGGNELVKTLESLKTENTDLKKSVTELTQKLKELEDKVNSFETE